MLDDIPVGYSRPSDTVAVTFIREALDTIVDNVKTMVDQVRNDENFDSICLEIGIIEHDLRLVDDASRTIMLDITRTGYVLSNEKERMEMYGNWAVDAEKAVREMIAKMGTE